MAISSNSRYANSTVATIDVQGQPRQVIVPSQAQAYTFNYTSHMWSQGDRLDRLAYQYLGDATQWYKIGDSNPELINIGEIEPGTIIRIPSL